MINAETAYLLDVYQTAKASVGSENIYLYARKDAQLSFDVPVDFEIANDFEDLKQSEFKLSAKTKKRRPWRSTVLMRSLWRVITMKEMQLVRSSLRL